jgi:hypothetical protein
MEPTSRRTLKKFRYLYGPRIFIQGFTHTEHNENIPGLFTLLLSTFVLLLHFHLSLRLFHSGFLKVLRGFLDITPWCVVRMWLENTVSRC